nr:phosphoribosylaminoimidazolesuccinocarboxamide synthase [Tepidiforma sp.]
MVETMIRSELPWPVYRGKVRDTYDLGDRLLIVATDRISALDVVLPTPIPGKGKVLTMLSAWWFERIGGVVPNHFIAVITEANRREVPFELGPEYFERSMLVRKAKRLDAECIARGYLAGSGWKEYRATGTVCGIPLPEGLRESDRLPEPIFTPSTKAAEGHDRNITYAELEELVGPEAANAMRIRTMAVYGYAHTVALERGIIIADTKLEFGWWNEEVILIDEVLTPDSSRFWLAEEYRPGGPQPSLDKQPVRDWLAANWRDGDPVPELPRDVVEATTERYLRAYRMLTGEELSL